MLLLALLLAFGPPPVIHGTEGLPSYRCTGSASCMNRPIFSKLGDQCSVLDYGAKCSSTGNDILAIQAALDDPTCGTILFPCGKTCPIGTGGLNDRASKTLQGCGIQSSTLSCSGGSGACVIRDGIQGSKISDLTIEADGASPTLIGLLDTNASGVSLRNSLENVRIRGDQSPPVTGSIGHFLHSVNANSLYVVRSINEVVGGFDKGVRLLGDDGTGSSPPVIGSTGGANDNHWMSPQIDNCVTGFSFEGYSAANTVVGLHCNGGGQAFDQLCVSLGDGTNTLIAGNKIEMYVDNAVSGHTGKSYAILTGANRNEIRSFSSGTGGTDANSVSASVNRNAITEYNSVSLRSFFQFGNIQIFADNAVPGIYLTSSTGTNLPLVLQNSSSDIVNAILVRVKANIAMTHAGAVLQEWNNTSRVVAFDLNGAVQHAGQAFANLGVPATPPNGTMQYCTDCTIANPCASGGTGAFAKRLNGVWVCN